RRTPCPSKSPTPPSTPRSCSPTSPCSSTSGHPGAAPAAWSRRSSTRSALSWRTTSRSSRSIRTTTCRRLARTASPRSRRSTCSRTARSSSRLSVRAPSPHCWTRSVRCSTPTDPRDPSGARCSIGGRLMSSRMVAVPSPHPPHDPEPAALTNAHASFQLGSSDPILLTVKAQLARLGYAVGDAASPDFDAAMDHTIKHFQQRRGLFSDGILGSQTFEQIELARHQLGDRVLRYDPVRPFRGDDVAATQERLSRLGLYTTRIDFEFAQNTDAAVRDIQKNLGLPVDGVAGPRTLRGLDAVTRGKASGDLFALQEKVRLQSTGNSLAGRTFVIDSAPQLPMSDDPALLAQHEA